MPKRLLILGMMTAFALYSPAKLWAEPLPADLASVMAKVERAESNQREMLKQLQEIQKELYVVKIRAGHRRGVRND